MPNYQDIMSRVQAGLLGPTSNYGGILTTQDEEAAKRDAQMAMYSNLLASSGWQDHPTTLGQAIGGAAGAGRQAQNAGLQQALQAQLMKQRIDAQKNRPGSDGVGDYQPRDYTPESWAEFVAGGQKDPAVLKRWITPPHDPTPSFRPVTRTLPDGSTEQGSFDTRTNQFHWSGTVVPAGVKARAEAEGKAEGEASGGQAAKAPVQASFDTAMSNLRGSIKSTQQGVVAGPLGSVFDYGDKKLFQSRVQQLSTELRTIYRIPGEGSLSDQEQAQYGLQLPSTDYPPEVNEQILNDLEARTSGRLQTPIGTAPKAVDGVKPAAKTGTKKRYNPATGKIE